MRLALLALMALAGCDQYNPQWQGWIYPDKYNLSQSTQIGRFSTLEECRISARNLIANIRLSDDGEEMVGDYECGRSCKADSSIGGMNVCEETSK